MSEKTKLWMKATLIRCIRTFFTTILGIWTGGQLITEVDWRVALISAVSTTVYILLICIVGGLPEVKYQYEDIEEIKEVEDEGD